AAALWRRRRFSRRAHRRQGLLALARGERIYDAQTLRLLHREALLRPDGVPTEAGAEAAAAALRDERRWAELHRMESDAAALNIDDGLTPIETALTEDQIAALDARIATRAA
ncbi:MAG: metal ABC transporter permease, partial [Pseudomonadota bacterium]